MLVEEILGEKINKNVRFEYVEDAEGDKNRGWTIDKVNAFIGDKEVGYLKLAYIPHQRFEKYYPGILNFLTQISGHQTLPYDYRTIPWQQIPKDKLSDSVYSMAQTAGIDWHQSNALQKQAMEGNAEVVNKIVSDLEKKLWIEKGWQFRRFKKYFVDKPLVDFIRVEDEYKRQGIGTALYRAGHEWMKSKGMKLYASMLQSDEAKATWDRMEKEFNVQHTRPMHPQLPNVRARRRYFA